MTTFRAARWHLNLTGKTEGKREENVLDVSDDIQRLMYSMPSRNPSLTCQSKFSPVFDRPPRCRSWTCGTWRRGSTAPWRLLWQSGRRYRCVRWGRVAADESSRTEPQRIICWHSSRAALTWKKKRHAGFKKWKQAEQRHWIRLTDAPTTIKRKCNLLNLNYYRFYKTQTKAERQCLNYSCNRKVIQVLNVHYSTWHPSEEK